MTGIAIKSMLNKFLASANCEPNDKTADVKNTAKELAVCVVDRYTNGLVSHVSVEGIERRVPDCSKTLLRVVDHMSERHNILFSSIVRRLDVSVDNIDQVFSNVVDEMFSDKQYNWGRVITVYAFAGWLARFYCVDTAADPNSACARSNLKAKQFAGKIATCAGNYVADHLSSWIELQGGWNVMDQFFAERDDPEGALWHGLLYTFVGLGALAAMAAVR